MHRRSSRFPLSSVLLLIAGAWIAVPAQAATFSLTASTEEPAAHFYHVALRCTGLTDSSIDFKLPVWTPGYYRVMDYAKNVVNFKAEDDGGRELAWVKTTKNAWRVERGGASTVTIRYDVYAFTNFVAESYLDATRGYIVPAGVFMHAAGHLKDPVTLAVKMPSGWANIGTGLDPGSGPATFTAPDFDILYDCPILLGVHETGKFEVNGIRHDLAIENVPPEIDRLRMAADLKKIVEAGSRIIGDIPYTHYSFLLMGNGAGGIEHLNSQASMFNGKSLATEDGYRNWLSFISHEYFHHYNVKRIRPIALGPFDYDRENYTNMLWVSEGFTLYYEDLVLVRAGLMTREQFLARLSSHIGQYENSPGHMFQSAVEASFDTWIKAMNRGEYFENTTISYYDKGGVLGALLDLKIRHETANRKSLDDVMRALYRDYYKERNRGFTDAEFRKVCESVAGGSLAEIFEYASSVKEIDYAKYFAYVGLEVDLGTHKNSRAFLGATVRDQDGNAVIVSVRIHSPAQQAGLSAQDQIIAINGRRMAAAKEISDMIAAYKPGSKATVLFSRRGKVSETEVTLGEDAERGFKLVRNGTASALFEDWLRAQ